MGKIKVLGIAPYESLKEMMLEVARNRDDVELDVYTANLTECIKILDDNLHKDYNVIISRGGTATELEKRIGYIPVVDISISVYDILRPIKLAQNIGKRLAIVGFPFMAQNAKIICELQQYEIDIYTVHDRKESYDTLQMLRESGYDMVLCGVITYVVAQEMGLPAILITSGRESVESAFDQAVKMARYYNRMQEEIYFYKDILRSQNCQTIIFSAKDQTIFATCDSLEAKKIHTKVKREKAYILSRGECSFFKIIDNTQYAFYGKRKQFNGKPCCFFEYKPTDIPVMIDKYGISYASILDMEKELFADNLLANLDADLKNEIEQLNHSKFPVMILGESGCGKSTFARYLHNKSRNNQKPFITIDCSGLETIGWNFLFNNINSPLSEKNCTIVFDNIANLPDDKRKHLLTDILDTQLCMRNQVFFIHTVCREHTLSDFIATLIHELQCQVFSLPALREQVNYLERYSSLYFNRQNQSAGNAIIGFTNDALQLLKSYDWPYNYKQLDRVLYKLSLSAKSAYIQADTAAKVLEQETAIFTCEQAFIESPVSVNDNCPIDLHQSLEMINRQIAKYILMQNGNNQSLAAKQLGIGRTTLWRMLKD